MMLSSGKIELLGILTTLWWLGGSRLIVETPLELKNYFEQKYNDSGIPYSIANFGRVPYGKSIWGEMNIPDVLQDCIYEETWEKHHAKILLVERNDCKFTQKAINVQKDGGRMAVIMDNQLENPSGIVMIDDGHGAEVQIPTILIRKDDGAQLLKYILDKQSVVIRINFEAAAREKADVTLWLDSSTRSSYNFVRRFKPYFNKLKEYINFKVAFPALPCSYCLPTNCVYDKAYCKNPPLKGREILGIGQELIKEQLREYFLFESNQTLWWAYMLAFDDNCEALNDLEDCSVQTMKQLKIEAGSIMKSVEKSFYAKDNQVLAQFQQLRFANSITFFPAVTVNSIVYRGNLDPIDVFDLVCESLDKSPQACSGTLEKPPVNVIGWVLLGVTFFVIFLIFMGVCYRRIVRRKLSRNINKQVNELVSQYITMYESDKFANAETQSK